MACKCFISIRESFLLDPNIAGQQERPNMWGDFRMEYICLLLQCLRKVESVVLERARVDEEWARVQMCCDSIRAWHHVWPWALRTKQLGSSSSRHAACPADGSRLADWSHVEQHPRITLARLLDLQSRHDAGRRRRSLATNRASIQER